jgi:hypothetical protein
MQLANQISPRICIMLAKLVLMIPDTRAKFTKEMHSCNSCNFYYFIIIYLTCVSTFKLEWIGKLILKMMSINQS